jgi:AcrR family transcriptional regulator
MTQSIAARPQVVPSAPRRAGVRDFQRARVLASMAEVACEHGVRAATVTRVLAAAGVSRKTFYEIFDGRDDCLLAAFDRAVACAAARARAAVDVQAPWDERMRVGLHALLAFFDEEPALAHLCFVQSIAAAPAVLTRRGRLIDELAEIVDGGRLRTRHEPGPLTAEGIVGGALAVVAARLTAPGRERLLVLLGPLMSSIVLPYLGPSAARRELHRRPTPQLDSSGRAPRPVSGVNMRLTYRTIRVISTIAAEPGLSNTQVSERAGVANQGQISKLLSRLAGLQLIENTGAGQPMGAANAWRLARRGETLARAIDHERHLDPGFATPLARTA